jgi:hypothetical protein
MKKLNVYGVILMSTLLLGCGPSAINEDGVEIKVSHENNINYDSVRYLKTKYESQKLLDKSPIVVRDGCQYLAFPGYTGYLYVHKGDCNNPIHSKQ